MAATLNISASGGVTGVAKVTPPASYNRNARKEGRDKAFMVGTIALVSVLLLSIAALARQWSLMAVKSTHRRLAGEWEAKKAAEPHDAFWAP